MLYRKKRDTTMGDDPYNFDIPFDPSITKKSKLRKSRPRKLVSRHENSSFKATVNAEACPSRDPQGKLHPGGKRAEPSTIWKQRYDAGGNDSSMLASHEAGLKNAAPKDTFPSSKPTTSVSVLDKAMGLLTRYKKGESGLLRNDGKQSSSVAVLGRSEMVASAFVENDADMSPIGDSDSDKDYLLQEWTQRRLEGEDSLSLLGGGEGIGSGSEELIARSHIVPSPKPRVPTTEDMTLPISKGRVGSKATISSAVLRRSVFDQGTIYNCHTNEWGEALENSDMGILPAPAEVSGPLLSAGEARGPRGAKEEARNKQESQALRSLRGSRDPWKCRKISSYSKQSGVDARETESKGVRQELMSSLGPEVDDPDDVSRTSAESESRETRLLQREGVHDHDEPGKSSTGSSHGAVGIKSLAAEAWRPMPSAPRSATISQVERSTQDAALEDKSKRSKGADEVETDGDDDAYEDVDVDSHDDGEDEEEDYDGDDYDADGEHAEGTADAHIAAKGDGDGDRDEDDDECDDGEEEEEEECYSDDEFEDHVEVAADGVRGNPLDLKRATEDLPVPRFQELSFTSRKLMDGSPVSAARSSDRDCEAVSTPIHPDRSTSGAPRPPTIPEKDCRDDDHLCGTLRDAREKSEPKDDHATDSRAAGPGSTVDSPSSPGDSSLLDRNQGSPFDYRRPNNDTECRGALDGSAKSILASQGDVADSGPQRILHHERMNHGGNKLVAGLRAPAVEDAESIEGENHGAEGPDHRVLTYGDNGAIDKERPIVASDVRIVRREQVPSATEYSHDPERDITLRSLGTQATGSTAGVQVDISVPEMAGTHSVLDFSIDTSKGREERVAYLPEGPNKYRGLLESNPPTLTALGSLVYKESLATAESFPAFGQRTHYSTPAALGCEVEENDHCSGDLGEGCGHPEAKGNPSVREGITEPGHDSTPARAASHSVFHGGGPAYMRVFLDALASSQAEYCAAWQGIIKETGRISRTCPAKGLSEARVPEVPRLGEGEDDAADVDHRQETLESRYARSNGLCPVCSSSLNSTHQFFRDQLAALKERVERVRSRTEARRRGRPIYLYESRAHASGFLVDSDIPTTSHVEVPAQIVDPESILSEEFPVNRTPNGKDGMVSDKGEANRVPSLRLS